MKTASVTLWAASASIMALTLGAAAGAYAADAAPASPAAEPPAVGEVVVTARMRAERLQDVPIAVTALSARQLRDRNVRDVSDFIHMVPNVSIVQSESAGLNQITIRGITQVRNSDAPVAVVVDGVQQVDPREFTQQLFDLQSVEVLRGPQGALYGRDAAGGAIIITTEQPTNEFKGHVMAGYGSGDEYTGEAVVSGPIIKDTLLFRIGAAYVNRAGYFDNIYLHKKQDPFQDFVGRGLLKWNVTNKLTVNLRYSHDLTMGGALNFWYQPANLLPDGVTLDQSNPFSSAPSSADRTRNYFYSTNIGEDHRSINQVSLKADYDLGFATLSSVTGYDKITEFVAGDQFPYTAGLTAFGSIDGTQTQYTDVSAWSQEVRLTSPSNQRLRWMVGAYYLTTDGFISSTTGDDRGQGIARVERTPEFSNAANPTLTFFADDNHNQAYAVFGNVDYDILPNLQAAIGLRYDEERRTQDVSIYNTGGAPGAVNKATFGKLQPKYTLTYKPIKDVSVYASYGVGFRSGQFNQNGTAAAAIAAGVQGVADLVPKESTTTAEVGLKAQLFENRLRIDGAFYHTDVTNSEYFVFIGAVGAQVLVPIDKTSLTGGEIEADADLGHGFTASLGYGATSSRIDAYKVNPADVGNAAPYVPNASINASVQYRVTLNDKLGLVARADYRRLGRQYWDPEETTARSPVNLLDLRFGFEDPAGRWSLMSTIQNATNAVYNAEYVLGGFSEIANPRVYRVQLRYNF
ncbi:MAG: TonB-dependent receptor [Caulobacteraceae bacterium]|nr:TonB-dependent receptor [Caulobacteraceae bacterium]